MIKSFRKSKRLSGSSSPAKPSILRVSSGTLAADASFQLPRRVIKALYDYAAQGPGELSFNRGDFFHLCSDNADQIAEESDGWFEATNPATNSKGMVPVSYFEVFGRSRPSVTSAPLESIAPKHVSTIPRRASNQGQGQLLYAIALFAFKAERPDELDITPGENLTICAHHQYEWLIAKPINRLGGPGLIPLTYVKIVDLLKPNDPQHNVDFLQDLDPNSIRQTVDYLHIPTVDEWKDQTAKYQALTIPLGSISRLTTPGPTLPHAQYFNPHQTGAPSLPGLGPQASLLAHNISIIEAGVDSYQLDHGRYQYMVVARLSNGCTRHLFRYYQDFYDLQVTLLDAFPYEAGKIENSKRTIPVIPGPLINVNDNISKLRREKLDYYLRNLIALPSHISRSQQVMLLFDVLENGFDREFAEGTEPSQAQPKRTSKPISQTSNSQQNRQSQYSQPRNSIGQSSLIRSRSNSVSRTNLATNTAPPSAHASELPQIPKFKVKFYYMDDIFVLLLPSTLRLQDLKTRLLKRLALGDSNPPGPIRLYLKNDYDEFLVENDIVPDENFSKTHLQVLLEFEIDNDEKFHIVLMDKVRLVVLTG